MGGAHQVGWLSRVQAAGQSIGLASSAATAERLAATC
jgi:hypothetical protein